MSTLDRRSWVELPPAAVIELAEGVRPSPDSHGFLERLVDASDGAVPPELWGWVAHAVSAVAASGHSVVLHRDDAGGRFAVTSVEISEGHLAQLMVMPHGTFARALAPDEVDTEIDLLLAERPGERLTVLRMGEDGDDLAIWQDDVLTSGRLGAEVPTVVRPAPWGVETRRNLMRLVRAGARGDRLAVRTRT